MTNLLIRLFIKDNKNVKNPAVRQAYGMLSGVVGICCNIALFLLKFAAGFLTGAVSIWADAFNNLSDAGSSIITFIGFKMAGKPADIDHPYGHGRIEYISGLIVAAAIIVMGVELFQQSVGRILHPVDTAFDILSVMILAGSILVKLWMAVFNSGLGRRLDSAAMKATAADSLSDCVSTAVVLVSLLICMYTGINVDGYAGAVVAVFVFMAGIGAAKDTLQPLLGQPADEEFVRQIEELVMEDTHIIGIHDLMIHDYGPGRVFASLHAEIPYTMEMLAAHEVIDNAEQRVMKQLGCSISIHMDPVVTDDAQVDALKAMTLAVLADIDTSLKMHDFRVAKRTDIINLIFDVVVPYNFALPDQELRDKISAKISENLANCNVLIQIDKAFVR